MAKRGRKRNDLASYAEGVGAFLGHVRSRWDELSEERGHLAKQLHAVINNAQTMLSEIGEGVARGAKRGRPAGTGKRGPGRPKRMLRKRGKMSAAARAKISAAQKKRWAAQKGGTRP